MERARVAQEGALERNAEESKVPEAGEGWHPPQMHERCAQAFLSTSRNWVQGLKFPYTFQKFR